jgi:hypothetical protein
MASPVTSWVPETDAEKRALEEQMERLLAHPVFKSSKRSAALLRHVVQATLQGQGALLKERTLGVEVFGRDAQYETNLDPVVRTTAGEVRKRIAQYYHEPGHEHEIRIDLPAGSYQPEFHLPAEVSIETAAPSQVTGARSTKDRKVRPFARIAMTAGVVLAVAAIAVRLSMPRPPIEAFWGPVLSTSAPVMIVIGEPPHAEAPASVPTSVAGHIVNNNHVVLADAAALSRLSSFLGQHGITPQLQGSPGTNFTDLQRGPAVLIAGFDNAWTMRLTSPLRFHFASETDPNLYWIEDRRNPADHSWVVNYGMPYSSLTQDYALVARFVAPATGQVTIVAAGVGDNGTAVAGDFLTNPKYAEALAQVAPKGWENKNIEVVIATQVIDGRSGPPRILAVESW